MSFLILKLIHILSATVLFGTGLGTAFYMWRAHKTDDARVIAAVAGQVVMADWLFTVPAVIIQPVTGLMMMSLAGYTLSDGWIIWALVLYVITGACWLPVVWLQLHLRDLANAAVVNNTPLPDEYYRKFMLWFSLGWPAFISVMIIFVLMVFRATA